MPDQYVELAIQSYTAFTKERTRIAIPDGLPEELYERRAGCFVSLHREHDLRGCIGTIAPTQACLAREIIENAISACARDPRFPAVTEDELPYITCNVDVLEPPEDIEGIDQLDPKRYGVIVSSGSRRGLLLPDLEGVDTAEEQVRIARAKAGLPAYADIQLQRFEVVRHV